MRQEGIKPGKIAYNTLLDAYARSGQHTRAEEVFIEMQDAGHSPDSYTYLSLICAYTNCQRFQEAEDLLKRMHRQGLAPGLVHFSHLVFAFGKARLVEDASRLYMEIEKAELKGDLACHRTMLKIYRDNGHTHEGILLFEKLQGYIEPDEHIYRMAIDLYESAGKIVEAKYILQLMKNRGFSYRSKLKGGIKLNTSEQTYTRGKREPLS